MTIILSIFGLLLVTVVGLLAYIKYLRVGIVNSAKEIAYLKGSQELANKTQQMLSAEIEAEDVIKEEVREKVNNRSYFG